MIAGRWASAQGGEHRQRRHLNDLESRVQRLAGVAKQRGERHAVQAAVGHDHESIDTFERISVGQQAPCQFHGGLSGRSAEGAAMRLRELLGRFDGQRLDLRAGSERLDVDLETSGRCARERVVGRCDGEGPGRSLAEVVDEHFRPGLEQRFELVGESARR